MKFNKDKVKKILVIKPAAIGDVLLSTPVAENLKREFPEAKLYFLTQKYCKEALTGNPFIDRILTYDLKYDGGWFIISNIRRQKYDLVIDLFGNPRTAVITYLSGARYRVGFRFNWRTLAYNIRVKPRSADVHNIEFNLDALRAIGIEPFSDKPYFTFSPVHKEFADKFFNEKFSSGKAVIGINPGGTWPTKVWGTEKFAELIKMLSETYEILIFWGNEKEKIEAEKLAALSGTSAVLIPPADLKYMGALIKKCAAFVTNDTGPMHLSWIMGVNTVAIFGPTNSHLQGPRNPNSVVVKNDNLDCLGCNLTQLNECPIGHKCMKGLDVERVYMCTLEIINKKLQ